VRVGYLGPEGTFTHAAALAAFSGPEAVEFVALPTIYDTVSAVARGEVERAVVPIENSTEGSVSATLDSLSLETGDVVIVGESVHAIQQCLITATPTDLADIRTVLSHPQASAQCAHWLREHLPDAEILTTSSTADAVRTVADRGAGWAALGPRLAAERYGCQVLVESVEDREGNRTRFVTLAPRADADAAGAGLDAGASKTSFVFWGAGTGQPGWLVRCLSELSDRGVNMTRIESRPRKGRLGEYMFFVDADGDGGRAPLSDALAALATHVEVFRLLGSYPAG
jgi:prephenate dehydratase